MKQFSGEEFSIRFSRRRKNIGLVVTVEGRLVIQAPVGTSRARIARALASHRRWIEEKTAQRREAWSRLQDGGAFLWGRAYRLTRVREAREPVVLRNGEIRVLTSGKELLWPRLRDWYCREAERCLQERVRHFSARMGLAPGALRLAGWKRRWGECHPGGALRFNWRLVMLPPEVVDYVVVHELAHLRIAGHPKEFWRQVEQVLPDYARRRQWLNLYGAPFLLWHPEERQE
jgi:predicted metal-dependent hydrolase